MLKQVIIATLTFQIDTLGEVHSIILFESET